MKVVIDRKIPVNDTILLIEALIFIDLKKKDYCNIFVIFTLFHTTGNLIEGR